MDISILPFNQLSARQVYDLSKLRQDVFIIEQNCIFPDLDDADFDAIHLLIYTDSELIAYSRLYAPDYKYPNSTSIGRIIVKQGFRGGDTGKTLISKSVEWCRVNFPDYPITIEAQAALINYYHNYGFVEKGGIYIVDDIPHIKMLLI